MKFHIETWGCQMNDHDSEKLAGLLQAEGHEAAASMDEADLVLLNTCSIREKAVHKVYSELGRLREVKRQRPLVLGVTGCLAQQDREGIFRRAPQVDLVLGTRALRQLPRLLEELQAGRRRVCDTGDYPDNHLFPPEVTQRRSTAKALVTILEGCNHACTYCVVPATRGPERSRPFGDILAEVCLLVAEGGYREVELLGQNVNSYAGGCTFAELLARLAEVPELEWIRFTTSHPMNFTAELAAELVRNPKVAPFLHLPVQSGSNAVLRRMHRGYTAEQYLERLGYLGEGRQRMHLSTDFIVGFPGETDADFEDTLKVLEAVQFEASFSFVFSPRPGTAALRLRDAVPEAVGLERLRVLQARQAELTWEAHRRFLGRTVDLRVESARPVEDGTWLARTGEWVNVKLGAPEGATLPFGRLVKARITEAGPHWLRGELLNELA
jgi:tRNA-2-methylthio-N6-dimethylallyladenosine synthase